MRVHSDECGGGMYKCCGPSAAAPPKLGYPLGTSTRLTFGPGYWSIYEVFGWLCWICAVLYGMVTGARYGFPAGGAIPFCGHYRGRAQFFRITGGFNGALQTTATRLVLRGGSHPCVCWPGRHGGLALRAEYKRAVPQELLARGITAEVWREWMEKLDRVQGSAHWFDLCRVSTTSYQPW